MINDRIKELIDYECNGNKRAFSQRIGVTPSVIENIVGTRGGKPSYDVLEKVVNAFAHIDLRWLFTGMGNMIITDGHQDEQNKTLVAHVADQGIPLIPLDAMAGFGTDNSTQVMEYECEKYVIPNFRGAEFLIQVKGSSMYPKYASGDIVACKKLPIDTFFQWNKVYVIDSEQGVLIKRIKPATDKERILLVSENPKYDPFELERKEINSLAIVIGVIRLE